MQRHVALGASDAVVTTAAAGIMKGAGGAQFRAAMPKASGSSADTGSRHVPYGSHHSTTAAAAAAAAAAAHSSSAAAHSKASQQV